MANLGLHGPQLQAQAAQGLWQCIES
jgi:hypothetical protein